MQYKITNMNLLLKKKYHLVNTKIILKNMFETDFGVGTSYTVYAWHY